jgi:hypothetical protein
VGIIPWERACELDPTLSQFAEEEAELEEEERREEAREADLQRAAFQPGHIERQQRPRPAHTATSPAHDKNTLPEEFQVALDATQVNEHMENDNIYVLTVICPSETPKSRLA